MALVRDSFPDKSPSVAGGITNAHMFLAEAQAAAGLHEAAMDSVQHALALDIQNEAYAPDIIRFRGDIFVGLGQPNKAEADFREAIARSQKTGAKIFELRAATSLARLLGDNGQRDETRRMLAEIYGWFTEGFDTADLKDAKALLDELNG